MKFNVLDVHNKRQTQIQYEHFIPVRLLSNSSSMQVIVWITQNLQGRFWCGEKLIHTSTGVVLTTYVAFEDPAEASYFTLVLDSII